MDAMLTDFIQAIPPSTAPPAVVNFPIQVGASPPAVPAIGQSLPTAGAPQRAPTVFLSSTPSTSKSLAASPTKDKKKQNKKKKKRESSSDSDTDVEFY